MKCLIIAAGQGSRLRHKGDSKPLTPLLGIPLIERVIRSATEAGADEFYVVTGYHGDRVRAFLERLADRLGIRITPIVNEAWDQGNGLSVLAAREHLTEPFILLMADHLFDPSLTRKLVEVSLAGDEIALGVDKDIHNPCVDLEDVTRVESADGKVRDIGKGLTDYNGFDTGIFHCTPTIFDALARCTKEAGDTTLSAAVQMMATEGRVRAVEVHEYWIDVDDPAAFQRAENVLLAHLRDKPNDGPIARHLNRPISIMISRRLVNTSITPNQISLFSFLCSMLAAGLFVLGVYPALLLGGVLAQFASIIDGCDGEVARLKFLSSDYGGWFDAVLDRYADAFLLFGLTWYAYINNPNNIILWTGFMAIIGSFMLSYTADKYDHRMRERVIFGKGFRLGRDVRVFLIFLGAVMNQVFLVLGLIALVMNLETVRRVVVCRNHV